MRVWLVNTGEPTALDCHEQRLRRVGILAKMLARRGHEVLWWSSSFFHMGKRQRFDHDITLDVDAGYRVHFLHSPKYDKNISLQRLYNHAVLGRKFRRSARHEPRPDVILASLPTLELSYEAVRFGRSLQVPTVLDIRDLWPDTLLDLVPTWCRPVGSLALAPYTYMANRACTDASAVCGCTREFVEWGLSRAHRPATNRDQVFPFGYARPQLSADESSAALEQWRALGVGVDRTTAIVCFFGGINHHFDFETVVDATRKLKGRKRVQFVVCGDGEDRNCLEKSTAGQSNIVFAGWVDGARIWTLMQMSTFGLAPYVPTFNFTNNIPNKPIEYLAGGLPILSALPNGALARLIDEKKCGICYDGNADLLADAIDGLLDHPDRLHRLRENALRAFQHEFDATLVYGRMMDYLEDLGGERRCLAA